MNIFIEPPFAADPIPQPDSFECRVCYRKFSALPECEALDQSRKVEKLRRLLKSSNPVAERPHRLLNNLLDYVYFSFLKMDKPESMPVTCDECRNHVEPDR